MVLIVIVWILSALLAILPVIGFGVIHIKVVNTCSPVVLSDNPLSLMYCILLILVGFFPFSISLVANIWILCFACKISDKNWNRHNTASSAEKLQSLKKKIHFAKIFGAFAINTVLILPFVVSVVLIAAFRISELQEVSVIVSTVVAIYSSFVIQSAIHPILETCVLGKATKVMYKSLHCCFKKCKEEKGVPS